MTGRWVVLNCPVSRVLGRYDDEMTAEAAAAEFGRCSFPCELSEDEAEAMGRATRAGEGS